MQETTISFPPASISRKLTAEKNGVKASFDLVTRSGATAEMVDETVRHYYHALACIQAGKTEATEAARTRTNYGMPPPWARVQIFGDIFIRVGDKNIPVNLNIFTEHTSAQDLLDLVAVHFGELTPALPGKAASAPLPAADPPAPPAPALPQSESGVRKGDIIVKGDLVSYATGATYTPQPGDRIAVRIVEVRAAWHPTGSTLFEFVSALKNGKPGRYANFELSFFTDNPAAMTSPQGKFLEPLHLHERKQNIQGDWWYIAEVVAKGDRVFFNPVGWVAIS